jgi:glycosyltransferase involved in cell wall biosynthesis
MSDSIPLITTVIPTYRRPKLLRRAIKSVLAQTYTHFQVCVYDNASGDETAAVVRELAEADPRVKYDCHTVNIGPVRNFVFGMDRVHSPFFSLLSDDDILLPDFFQKALEGFERYPEAVFSSLATINIDNTGHVLSVHPKACQEGFHVAPKGLLAMLKYGHPTWTAILFRRDVMEKVGGLDQETGGPSDLDYELRIAAKWPFVISSEPGAIFVSHGNSYSGRVRLESLWPAWQRMIRNLVEDENIPYEVRLYAEESLFRRFRSHHLVLGGLAFVVQKDWREAEQAAEILRDQYHCRIQALLLRSLSWAARRLPPAHFLMSRLNDLRKSLSALKSRKTQSEFSAFAPLLDEVNSHHNDSANGKGSFSHCA